VIRRNPLPIWIFALTLVTIAPSTRAPASDIDAADQPVDATQGRDVVGLLEEILVELKVLKVELLEHRVELREEKISELEENLGRADSRRAEIEGREREAAERLKRSEDEPGDFHAQVALHEVDAAREERSELDRDEERIVDQLDRANSDLRKYLERLAKLRAELDAVGR